MINISHSGKEKSFISVNLITSPRREREDVMSKFYMPAELSPLAKIIF
jgi:hypothetical protein